MPSTLRYNRRPIIYSVLAFLLICYLMFSGSSSSEHSFRTRTEAGLARVRNQNGHKDLKSPLQENLPDEDVTKKANEKLQSILDSKNKNDADSSDGETWPLPSDEAKTGRKGPATVTTPHKPTDASKPPTKGKFVHDVEDVVDDSKKSTVRKPKSTPAVGGSEKSIKTTPVSGDATKPEKEKDAAEDNDPAGDFVRSKLMEYLKNPVVIFSKSYCPHSKRAKNLLLQIYSITPKPLVVELDQLGDKVPSSTRNLGQLMQEVLGSMTGRTTVPNIMVGGIHSIGGNDKIWELHEKGLLAEEIRKLGGRKITEVDVVGDD